MYKEDRGLPTALFCLCVKDTRSAAPAERGEDGGRGKKEKMQRFKVKNAKLL